METLQTITINGREYQSEQLEFDDAWLLLVRIVGIVAPSIGRISSIADAVQALGSLDLGAIPQALLGAGPKLLDQLFERAWVLDGNKRVRLNTRDGRSSAFGVDFFAAAKVAYFVLEHNYSDSIKAAQRELQPPSHAPLAEPQSARA